MKDKELERFNHLKKMLAIALKYDPALDAAPVIIAKGKGEAAKKIIEIGKKENIYIEKAEEVAEILDKYSVKDYIPFEVYSIVAEILFKVFKKESC